MVVVVVQLELEEASDSPVVADSLASYSFDSFADCKGQVVSFAVAVVVVTVVGQGSPESDSNPGIVVEEAAAGSAESVVDSVAVVVASEAPAAVSAVSSL